MKLALIKPVKLPKMKFLKSKIQAIKANTSKIPKAAMPKTSKVKLGLK